jgi:glucose/arabinose dehydrogenase
LLALVVLAAACGSDTDDATPGPYPTALTVPTSSATSSGPSSTPTTAPGGSTGTTAGPSAPTTGATAPPALDGVRVELVEVAELEQPVAIGLRPDDPTIYVAERTGRVRALRDGQVDPTPVLDISTLTRAQGERGFLGMAFSPDGSFLYVSYTDPDGDSHVDELAVASDGSVDAASRRGVLFQDQPYSNHNGGNVAFGPDGYLYIGFGDGGAGGDPERRAMRLDTWLGKLLRIDPRASGGQPYTVPADNPFVGQAGALPEIWSLGLRNPWRFSFDAATGDLWIGDVGQNQTEEIDLAPTAAGGGKGLNFGWSAFEGTNRYNDDQPADGTVGPVHTYDHGDDLGGCSVTGGYVYRGSAIPGLEGAYVFADYCTGGVRAIPGTSVGAAAVELTADPGGISSFGEGPDGELYVLVLEGPLLAIRPA